MQPGSPPPAPRGRGPRRYPSVILANALVRNEERHTWLTRENRRLVAEYDECRGDRVCALERVRENELERVATHRVIEELKRRLATAVRNEKRSVRFQQ
jgi:hypothetical protein